MSYSGHSLWRVVYSQLDFCWFGLISLFNVRFADFFPQPKSSVWKEKAWYYLTLVRWRKGVHAFLKSINTKVERHYTNYIELANYYVTVQHPGEYATRTHLGYPGYNTKVKLATLVEGDLKPPFSIATTPSCRGGCNSFPWIAPLYSWSLPHNAES